MIKALILDLNGVLIQSPNLGQRIEQDFGVPEKIFLPVLETIMQRVRQPSAEDTFSLWQPHLQDWNIPLNQETFFDYWFSAAQKNTDMINLLKQVHSQDKHVFILSNNFKERTTYYRQHFSFLNELVDKAYFSHETGFIKPDKRAFECIFSEQDIQPNECLYFDDSQKNVTLGEQLGINSHLFKDADQVANILQELNEKAGPSSN